MEAACIEKAKENYKADNWIDDKKSKNAENTLTAFIGNLKFIKLNILKNS